MPCPMAAQPPRPESSLPDAAANAWYRQSIVWLAAAIFVASILGCVWMIVIAQRYSETPSPATGARILKVPIAAPPSEPPP